MALNVKKPLSITCSILWLVLVFAACVASAHAPHGEEPEFEEHGHCFLCDFTATVETAKLSSIESFFAVSEHLFLKLFDFSASFSTQSTPSFLIRAPPSRF